MRAGEEYAELTDLGGPFGSRYGPAAAGSQTWSRTPGRSRGPLPAEAEDVLGPNGSPRGHARGRSGLYYSPPGTSYTIVERPSSVMHHHSSSRDYNTHYSTLSSPRGTYLGSNPNFSTARTPSSNNKKRPISPEQVLRLFGSTANQSGKGNPERPRRSPASSPPSTTHQINYRTPYIPNIHELATRTVTMVREAQEPGFGICVKGGKEADNVTCDHSSGKCHFAVGGDRLVKTVVNVLYQYSLQRDFCRVPRFHNHKHVKICHFVK